MENPFQDDTLLARWLENNLGPEELEALRQREDYEDFVQIIEDIKNLEPEEFSTTLVWQRLQEKLKKQASSSNTLPPTPLPAEEDVSVAPPGSAPPPVSSDLLPNPDPLPNSESPTPVRRLLSWKTMAGIAAAVALLLFAWWIFRGGEYEVPAAAFTVATQVGEQKEVKLPDGSLVRLNAVTTLGYSPEGWESNRYVVLEGEAYFNTQKGRRFTVHTGQGQVQVIGTVFNVYARDSLMEVQCLNGKVQVSDTEGLKVLLKPGEQVSVQSGRLQKRQGLAISPIWHKGTSAFRSAPLERVFAEMERQYGVVVVADSIEGRIFSGKFIHNDLNKALKMVCAPMRLKFELIQDTVKIY